ncbi:MAG: hypothetical protein EPO28_00150 [Saprospiraceae bacterium]|nr:MAG: hypothetical protein EPO28_00150 [Saprospiraceae bacterium]
MKSKTTPEERINFLKEEFHKRLAWAEDYERMVAQEEKEALEARSEYFRIFGQLPAEDFVENLEKKGISKLDELRWKLEDLALTIPEPFYWLHHVFTENGLELLDAVCERDNIEPIDLHLWIWAKVKADYELNPQKYENLLEEWGRGNTD